MIFLTWLSQMREPSWYILTRCVMLSCAMLLSALVTLIWAGGNSVTSSLLQSYAAHTATMSLVVLATGGFGSAFMEDILGPR